MVKKIKGIEPDIRYLNDMKEVIYDRKWLKKVRNTELYYMYRGVKEKGGLRYDITIIPPLMMGQEFAKTKGHYHKGSLGELYIILAGKAIYLLQKEKDDQIEDVYYIEAGKGDHIIIPPLYGHVTINPSSQELKMANWISKKCVSDYQLIEKKGGACYFYTLSGWIKNKNYQKIPQLKQKRPEKEFPKNLNFLYGNKN